MLRCIDELSVRNDVWESLKEEMKGIADQCEVQEEPQAKKTRYDEFMLDSSDDSLPREKNVIEDEIQTYLRDPKSDIKAEPLLFWKVNYARFPRLSLLATKYLSIPATSVQAERIFSTLGNVVTKKRACLDGERIHKLIFLSDKV